jgi:hypothetical protein
MGLHEELMGQNPERLVGLCRGFLRRPSGDITAEPEILNQYPALAALVKHSDELLLEAGFQPSEASDMSLGIVVGYMALARYAQSELPGSENKYPIL